MKKFRIIGVLVLGAGVLILPACANAFMKSPEKACGPYPGPDENSANVELVGMGQDSQFHSDLAKQPVEYVRCRADRGDQDAFYVMGLFALNGIQIPQNYKAATTYFSEATYKAAGRGTNIIQSGGKYAGIVSFKTSREKPGVLDAYYQLGKMHQQGLIKGIDLELAVWFYKIAANKGHVKAAEALAELTSQEGGEK